MSFKLNPSNQHKPNNQKWFGLEEDERNLTDEEKREILLRLVERAAQREEEIKRFRNHDPRHHGGTEW